MKQKIRKQNNKVYFIIILFVAIFSLAAGYAIFSESLNINGTAVTSGNFNVEFLASSIVSSNGCTPTSTISTDKNGITISVPDLKTPGSGAIISVIVKNTGNVTANLLNVVVTGNNDSDINITYPEWPTGILLQPGDTYTFSISVFWNTNSTSSNKSITFSAKLNYEQSI
ncbi:MAG: hypothetical protein PHN42_01695 [Bacilli bacterium]|nr:hypothetical protein [Bacilli bacterium]